MTWKRTREGWAAIKPRPKSLDRAKAIFDEREREARTGAEAKISADAPHWIGVLGELGLAAFLAEMRLPHERIEGCDHGPDLTLGGTGVSVKTRRTDLCMRASWEFAWPQGDDTAPLRIAMGYEVEFNRLLVLGALTREEWLMQATSPSGKLAENVNPANDVVPLARLVRPTLFAGFVPEKATAPTR